jgi:hypothetical protein
MCQTLLRYKVITMVLTSLSSLSLLCLLTIWVVVVATDNGQLSSLHVAQSICGRSKQEVEDFYNKRQLLGISLSISVDELPLEISTVRSYRPEKAMLATASAASTTAQDQNRRMAATRVESSTSVLADSKHTPNHEGGLAVQWIVLLAVSTGVAALGIFVVLWLKIAYRQRKKKQKIDDEYFSHFLYELKKRQSFAVV